jgi:hypothetical protein
LAGPSCRSFLPLAVAQCRRSREVRSAYTGPWFEDTGLPLSSQLERLAGELRTP